MLIFGVVSDYMFFGQTEKLQYLPAASALIVGGLTLTSFTLQNGIIYIIFSVLQGTYTCVCVCVSLSLSLSLYIYIYISFLYDNH